MSVLAGIEAGTDGRAGPGDLQVLAGAHGRTRGWPCATEANVFSSAQLGTEGLRSTWQLQFASFVSAADTSGKRETAEDGEAIATHRIDVGKEPIQEETAEDPVQVVSTPVAGPALRLKPATGQEAVSAKGGSSMAGSASGAISPALAASGKQIPALPPVAGKGPQPAASEAAKSPRSSRPLDLAIARLGTSGKSASQESGCSAPVLETILTALEDPSQRRPKTANGVPAASGIEAETQARQFDLPTVSSTGFMQSLIGSDRAAQHRPNALAGLPVSGTSPGRSRGLPEEVHQALVRGQSRVQMQFRSQEAERVAPPASVDRPVRETKAGGPHSSPFDARRSRAGKSGGTQNRSSTEQVAIYLPHQAGSAEAARQENRVHEGGAAGLALDEASLVRDPSFASGEASAAGGKTGGLAGVAPRPGARPVFEALDAGAGPEPPRLVQAANLPVALDNSALSKDSGKAGAIDFVPAESPSVGQLASLSGRARIQTVEPEQPIVQVQGQIQPHSEGQAAERIPGPASGDRTDRGAQASDAVAFQPQAALPRVRRPGVTGIGAASQQVALRASQRVEAGGLAMDASTLVRDPAGTHGAMGAIGESPGISRDATAGSAVRETFATLDDGANHGSPTWIHAGAQRAEAGFQDPALGWVGVRADVNGGSVHATLMPASQDAAEALGGHMAGLNAYLAEEHTPVETLTLAMPEGNGGESGAAGQDANHGMSQGEGQNAGQDGSSQWASNPQPAIPAVTSSAGRGLAELTARFDPVAGTPGRGGTHISVVA